MHNEQLEINGSNDHHKTVAERSPSVMNSATNGQSKNTIGGQSGNNSQNGTGTRRKSAGCRGAAKGTKPSKKEGQQSSSGTSSSSASSGPLPDLSILQNWISEGLSRAAGFASSREAVEEVEEYNRQQEQRVKLCSNHAERYTKRQKEIRFANALSGMWALLQIQDDRIDSRLEFLGKGLKRFPSRARHGSNVHGRHAAFSQR